MESAKKLAERYDVPTALDDYRELLKNTELDAVHICTPNASHYPDRKGCDIGREARSLREAGGDLNAGGRGAGGACSQDRGTKLRLSQSALLSYGAADA